MLDSVVIEREMVFVDDAGVSDTRLIIDVTIPAPEFIFVEYTQPQVTQMLSDLSAYLAEIDYQKSNNETAMPAGVAVAMCGGK